MDGPGGREPFGFSLLTLRTWDSNRELFGLLPAIWGTLYSSIIGLAIGTFFGLSIAIVLSQDFLPPAVETVLKNLIELLAAVPECRLRSLGHLRRRAGDQAVRGLVHGPPRVDSDLRHAAARPRHAAGVRRPRDHGAADGVGALA